MLTKVVWTFRVLAILAALVATVQPFLGSFSLFLGGEVDYEQIHLVFGGILYNLVLALLLVALFTGFRRRTVIAFVCLLQYGLLHLQLLLGLGSNEDAALLAFHIPVGVLIFFLAYLTVALGFSMRMESQQA